MKIISLASVLFAVALLNSCKKDTIVPTSLTASEVSDMYTETAKPVQKSITHYVDANIGGYLEALPAHYKDHPYKHYPLIIFLNGSGSLGDGSKSSLGVEDNIAIPHLIQKGEFPANFVVNGHTHQFIVLTPQFKSWPMAENVNHMINYAIEKYRIDKSRLYVCGLSMGGGAAWDYAAAFGKRIAAMVPICGASSPTTQKAQSIARDNTAVWAFHNNGDPTVPSSYSVDYVKDINNCHPNIHAKLTLFQAVVHNAWSKATDPDYKENGKNIYQWMLNYRKR